MSKVFEIGPAPLSAVQSMISSCLSNVASIVNGKDRSDSCRCR